MDKLIIFDFDDTLFPSTAYVSHTIKSSNVKLFHELDVIIHDVLEFSSNIADVLILSDGDNSWLKEILSHLPLTTDIIKKRIKIISTVIFYADKFRYDISNYKYNYLKDNGNLNKYSTIINIGDGMNELKASKELIRYYNIKHVKFIYRPTIHQWLNEIVKMKNIIKLMFITDKNILSLEG